MDINGTNSVTLKDSLLYQERISATPPYYPWSDTETFTAQRRRKHKVEHFQEQQQQSSQ